MDYQISGWHSVIWGAILVSIGAFFVSGGWALISKSELVSKWVKKFLRIDVSRIIVIFIVALLFITSGSVLVGVGGTKTTLGWKQLDNASQKKALLIALAREWLVNELCQGIPALSFDPNDPNLGVVINMYTPFKTSASNLVMTSNLFDLGNKDDLELCLKTMLYELSITSCNELFTLLDWDMTREGTTDGRRKELYQQTVRGTYYEGFKESHEEIGKLLKEKYTWALKEAMLFLNEKSQKKLREKYKWLSEEQWGQQ
ncbi:MAG: hypothetical protein ABSG99_09600 [Sedimentisphaerales bacterium]